MSEAMSLARVDRGLYKCASCGLTFSRQRVHRDHINPVVDPDIGFVDWNSYIERLFVDATQIQIMCELCHSVKTSLESAIRGIKGSQRK
jgi:5-methylcytosine-specific restriction endonuclease McrA